MAERIVTAEVVTRVMSRMGETYAKARPMKSWRPPPGLYNALYVDLSEGSWQDKATGNTELRWSPVFEILDGEHAKRPFPSNTMLTNNEGSMGDFHLLVEALAGHSIQPPNLQQDRQFMLENRGKLMVSIQVDERVSDKGKSYPDDEIKTVTPVEQAASEPAPATA